MKGNTLLLGMACLLSSIALAVAILVYQFVQLTRALNNATFTMQQVELRQNRLKALVNEAVEYSQRNPAINPLLYSIGAKQPPAAQKPAGR